MTDPILTSSHFQPRMVDLSNTWQSGKYDQLFQHKIDVEISKGIISLWLISTMRARVVSFSSASRLRFFSSTLVIDFLSSEVPLASWHRLSTGSGSSSHENKYHYLGGRGEGSIISLVKNVVRGQCFRRVFLTPPLWLTFVLPSTGSPVTAARFT